MESYKQQFIEFMVESNVLMFGDFVTRSGRNTPFFINTGKYETGRQMQKLGQFYAQTIAATVGDDIDFLYGPAYKGIPLSVAAAIGLADKFNRDLSFCFNRKEAKDHGEGGSLIGHKPVDGERVVIVEDVTTAGTSIRESVALLGSAAKVRFTGVIVSVDRMEKGATSDKSAIQEIRAEFGIPVYPIVTLDEIVDHLYEREIGGRVVVDSAVKAKIDDYRNRYGAA